MKLAASARYCRDVIKAAAPDFYLISYLWPKSVRLDFWVLFAFARSSHDGAHTGERLTSERFVADRRRVLKSRVTGDDQLWPEFFRVIDQHGIPISYPLDLLDALVTDVRFVQPARFQDLYRYCYRLSGVFGVMIAYIMGVKGQRQLKTAERLGVAMHLTDILRSTAFDQVQGRLYLPSALLKEVGAVPSDFTANPPLLPVKMALAKAAKQNQIYYNEAMADVDLLPDKLRRPVKIAANLYAKLLSKLQHSDFRQGVRLSITEKVIAVLRGVF